MKQKPNLSFWQLWNISVGYIGIQLGFSLQGQSSRIFSSLGADASNLPILWLGAPLAGLLVQPLIGLFSDKTWVKGLGRRMPFLLAGGIVAALAMCFMVNAEIATAVMPAYLFAAFMLLFMDCAFNASMNPMRALIADMTNEKQRTEGYSIQMILSNLGAIFGFALPFILAAIGVSNVPAEGESLPPSLIWSFYIGGAVIMLSILWTTFRVKEFPPKEFAEYNGITEEEAQKKESFFSMFKTMPKVMYQVAIVQFFTWFSLFILWTYIVNGLAENVWHITIDAESVKSAEFNEAGNWWGMLGVVQSVVAVIFAAMMGSLANKFTRKKVYSFALFLGAIGLMSMFLIQNQYVLLVSIIGMGVATAGMNAMPFAIISAQLPAKKIGVYMGIFNLAIVLPQILFAITGGFIFDYISSLGGTNITMIFVSGVSLLIAALCVYFVKDKEEVGTPQFGDK